MNSSTKAAASMGLPFWAPIPLNCTRTRQCPAVPRPKEEFVHSGAYLNTSRQDNGTQGQTATGARGEFQPALTPNSPANRIEFQTSPGQTYQWGSTSRVTSHRSRLTPARRLVSQGSGPPQCQSTGIGRVISTSSGCGVTNGENVRMADDLIQAADAIARLGAEADLTRRSSDRVLADGLGSDLT